MDYLEQRIKEIEEEIAKTPKNKGTEKHLSKLKSKLAILKEQLQKKKAKSSGKSPYQFSVKKEGDATVAMIGYPSVGKSSLLNLLTNAESEVADYAFTTLNVVPGIMEYKGARIQLLDLPGIIEGASYGKGRGKEVLSAARNADLILIISDVDNYEEHFPKIEKELYEAGFRLNKEPPEVKITKKDRGGLLIKIASSVPINEKDVKELAADLNLHNAEIIITKAESLEDIADALIGNRKYVKAIRVVNKSDKLKETPNNAPYLFISVHNKAGIDMLKERIWEKLELIRIFTKKPGEKPDLSQPLIAKKNSSVEDIKEKLKLKGDVKYARVWGNSVKFHGQKVGKDHVLRDKDIVEIITN